MTRQDRDATAKKLAGEGWKVVDWSPECIVLWSADGGHVAKVEDHGVTYSRLVPSPPPMTFVPDPPSPWQAFGEEFRPPAWLLAVGEDASYRHDAAPSFVVERNGRVFLIWSDSRDPQHSEFASERADGLARFTVCEFAWQADEFGEPVYQTDNVEALRYWIETA